VTRFKRCGLRVGAWAGRRSIVSKGELTFSIDARRHRIFETRNDGVDDSLSLNSEYALVRKNYRVIREGAETLGRASSRRRVHRALR
jgi:hypothetical protein